MKGGKYTLDGGEVLIDGENRQVYYQPLCGKCYLQKVMNKSIDFSKE